MKSKLLITFEDKESLEEFKEQLEMDKAHDVDNGVIDFKEV